MSKKPRRPKNIVLASIALVSWFVALGAFAQVGQPACPPPFGEPGYFGLNSEEKIELSVVVDAPELTKDQLYWLAKAWYLELREKTKGEHSHATLPSPQLTIDDKERGELQAAWVATPYDSPRVPNLRFTLQIVVRDGESEISISGLMSYFFILGRYDPLSAERFFHVKKPHKRYKKKSGEMVKVRRLECEHLIEYGNKIVESYSEAMTSEEAAGEAVE